MDGGGEEKGIVGMVVGICGIEGIVGREVDGSGASVTFGMVGIDVKLGFDKVGIWVLGKGGNVGLGRVEPVGRVGKGTDGNGDSVALGWVGKPGNGGIVGSVGREVCTRWRASRVVCRLESTNAIIKAAIFCYE